MDLLEIEADKMKFQHFSGLIKTLFEMFLPRFLNELVAIKYVTNDQRIDAIHTPIFELFGSMENFIYSTASGIFAGKNYIYAAEFRDRVMENYRWILIPHEV